MQEQSFCTKYNNTCSICFIINSTLSTSVHNCLLLTQLPDCCVSFQIVLSFPGMQLIYCVCLISMLNVQLIQFKHLLKKMGGHIKKYLILITREHYGEQTLLKCYFIT